MRVPQILLRLNRNTTLSDKLLLAAPCIEPGGTTCFNLVKNANHGAFAGTVTRDVFHGGRLPAGSGAGRINFGSLGGLPAEGTISFWMYSSALENYNNVLDMDSGDGGDNHWRFEETSAGKFVIVVDYADSSDIHTFFDGTTESISTNTWYHVVTTWSTNKNEITGYFNGQMRFDETQDNWVNPNFSNIEALTGFNRTRPWKGGFQNFCVWERRLSQAEVGRLYIDPWQIYVTTRPSGLGKAPVVATAIERGFMTPRSKMW